MRKIFMCSLCCGGILGGALYLEPQAVTYRTQKFTVDPKYRNLVLPMKEIKQITWKRMVFPVATFYMKNGEQYKIIIFGKKRFCRYYQEYSKNAV